MKRFTETQKWEDPWFRRLPIHLKALWSWLLDKCDNAGVIEPDIDLASFQIGYQYPINTLLEFGERVVKIGPDKWFIPKFISFQYGSLSSECKAHNPVFASLKKHGLEGYPKGIDTLQEKEEVKDKEKVTEKDDLELQVEVQESQKPDPERIAVGKLLGRRESTKWSADEIKLLKSIQPIHPDDLSLMRDFYGAEIPKETDYRRTTIERLLKHWNGELDKARIWKATKP